MNYVLNNVKDPVRTLKIAGPLGLGICAVLYLLANVAYFAAASKDEILKTGVTVAVGPRERLPSTESEEELWDLPKQKPKKAEYESSWRSQEGSSYDPPR